MMIWYTALGPEILTYFKASNLSTIWFHIEFMKWKYFPLYWPSVRGIHRWSVNFPHKGQWRGALTFSLICAWAKDRVNHRDVSDLIRHRAHYDVTVIFITYRRAPDTFQPIACLHKAFDPKLRCGWYLRRRRRATPYFFRHHGISYGWHSNSSVGDSNYCYVIRRTY